ncbi:hypothetical protein FEZ41_04605 [Lentilactobacillus parafarraginis]|uniref:Uncharacterized protein n=1 Tax=Lentilactobacillus parafarraginis TaxID=390842 RepID=A0A5R9CY97_9LACO|nr:hypothetical protein FEZ41_04605 [Lentilactobacillus parafarraginis]
MRTPSVFVKCKLCQAFNLTLVCNSNLS